MPNCAIATCKNCNQNTKYTEIKYFSFPRNTDLAKQWIIACRREDKINLKNATLCSIHFEEKCFEIPLKQRLLNYTPKNSRHLRPDAVPTLNLPGNPGTSYNRKSGERSLRLGKRRRREEVENILNTSPSTLTFITPQILNNDKMCEEPLLILSDNEQQLPQSKHEQIIESYRIKIDELRIRVNILETQNSELLKQIEIKDAKAQKYEAVLARVFTPGQIKKLINLEKNIRICWSSEDIASAISLRSVSPKAYRYLRSNNYPLPAMSTLRSWVSNFDVSQGILKSVVTLMKKRPQISASLTDFV